MAEASPCVVQETIHSDIRKIWQSCKLQATSFMMVLKTWQVMYFFLSIKKKVLIFEFTIVQ